jgi:RNA polymerase sigma-70 factor (ECF subfamily)
MTLLPRRQTIADTAESSAAPVAEAGLVARVRAGDEAAFESLFKAYYHCLCSFANGYVRSPDTAEELVQSVFLRIWERRESWAPAAGVRAYLFAASRNHALDHLRHERVVERLAPCASDHPAAETRVRPGPDEEMQAVELAAALRRAVEELPERRREVVTLRWQHQLTNLEIAKVLGISVKGVEAHVTRSLTYLRERLRPFR